ncbi:MAG: HAMP domain-containing sensor histidine kinase [Ilumatobacteraceae bacterium]
MRRRRRTPGYRTILTRLVLVVVAAMAGVLILAGGFVFWRVEYALDRQLDQDLAAYGTTVERALRTGTPPPVDTPGQSYEVVVPKGGVVGNAVGRLASDEDVRRAASGETVHADVGHLLPAQRVSLRVVSRRIESSSGPVVVSTAISKQQHDEALRELLLQLLVADVATLAAAGFVGYHTARAALDPVERYRLAAEASDGQHRLPVAHDRDDEITRLGHTFNALLDRLHQAAERERQFLADASHELRSPVALMHTELEVALRRQPRDDATRLTLVSLDSQVDRLIAVSNALLDLEELRSDERARATPMAVNELLASVAARYAERAGDRVILIDAANGLELVGVREWVDLATDNLLSNALRYGAGTVTLSASVTDDLLLISVSDQGMGFPLDFVGTAFDRFTRAEPSRSSAGTGLGLAIVQAVAEAHHGTAAIHGSTVRMAFPSTGDEPT